MTTYSPDYTSRYRAHYNACGITHTVQLRKALGATPGATALLAGTLGAIFGVWTNDLADDFAWLSAEQADQGSDIFYPTDPPPSVTGLKEITRFTPFQKVTHTRFGGRGFGSRASFEMFGVWWEYSNILSDLNTIGYDGKVLAAEDPRVASTIALLNTQAFANSGGPTTWNPIATIKVNDYWLKKVRSGGIT